ncbi:MAG: hypothetical protein LBC48_05065 [Dysgonamonadaceae bacterium]|nr:hypothetical protein [Dysgonamonadaceae bacterium]
MEATLSYPPLNATQLHLLKMFSYTKNEDDLQELKTVLLDFYHKKLDEETDQLWTEGKINDAKIEEMLQSHYRTPYNQ